MRILKIFLFIATVIVFTGTAMAANVTIYKNSSLDGTYTLGSMSVSGSGDIILYVTSSSTPPPGQVSLGLSPSYLPSGTVNAAYSQNVAMTASGGTSPYSYSCSLGSCVSGMTVSASSSTCTVGGIPAAAGNCTVNFSVTDSAQPPTTDVHTMSFNVTSGSSGGEPLYTTLTKGVSTPFNMLAGDTMFFKATLDSTCTTSAKQLRILLTVQQGAPNLDMFVKKSANGTLPWPTINDYNAKLAQTGYTPGPWTDGTFFWNFTNIEGETIPVFSSYSQYPNFNQADTYYILMHNTNQTKGASFTVKYYCY